jgi:glycosyltransferase involved in cell wall biosynthesis
MLQDEPALELRIAGSPGDAQSRLERLATELGSRHRVSFLGRVSHDEKVRLLRSCAVYLQPSLHEGFGVAAAEAMASGAPVVASRAGSLPEVLGNDAIWMTSRSVEAVIEGITRARRSFNEEQRQRAADRIRRCFSYERRRAGIVRLITELVPERSVTTT